MNRDDVRVVEGRGGFRLQHEQLQPLHVAGKLRTQEFQSDMAFQGSIARQPDLAHSTGTDAREDFELSETLSFRRLERLAPIRSARIQSAGEQRLRELARLNQGLDLLPHRHIAGAHCIEERAAF